MPELKQKQQKICLICRNDIAMGDSRYMISNDLPYFNLYVHRGCYVLIKDSLSDFIKNNIDSIVNYTKKSII